MKEILTNLISMLIGLVIITIPFVDKVVLRPVHRRKLQAQFKTWWKTVENYDQLQLALKCAQWAGEILDNFFGKKLLSKKVFFRCAIIANSILIISMSWVGFANGKSFGVTPWKNYGVSIKGAEAIMDGFLSNFNVEIYGSMDVSNAPPFDVTTNAFMANKVKTIHIITNEFLINIGTNTCEMRLTKNAEISMTQVEPLGQGSIDIFYTRRFDADQKTNTSTNFFGKVITSKNPFNELQNDAVTVRSYIVAHDKTRYVLAYSFVYFFLLFSANTFLFVGSLTLCRISLREIVFSERLISSLALVIVNIVVLFLFTFSLLLFLTLLATPILWLLFPIVFEIAKDSIYTFCVYLLGTMVTAWIISGISAKLIALIALLPNIFAGILGGFSILAMRCKKAFHLIVSGILIRCVENNPVTVILGTVIFITALIALIARWMHLTAFL